MLLTHHARHRMANRGFDEPFIELLHRHGDYIEQVGGTYALRMDRPHCKAAMDDLASEESELMHLQKQLKEKHRRACADTGPRRPQKLDALADQLGETEHALNLLHRTRRAVKPGYGIFVNDKTSGEVKTITVAHTLRSIPGYFTLKEH